MALTTKGNLGPGRTEQSAFDAVHSAKRKDLWFAAGGLFVLAIAMSLLFTLIGDLIIRGTQYIDYDFMTSYPSRLPERAGILSAWVGSLLVMLVTAFLAVPVGIAAGLYLEEYARKGWFSDFIEINVSNLAGVPSIIYGLLALGMFVYGMGLGQTILVAGMTLALLILPIVIVSTREAVRSIPQIVKEGAYGIGADQWQVMWNYIIPAARPGIMTGAIVGLSRAIGETAPLITIGALTFIAFLPSPPVTGEFPFISFAWLHDGFTVLPIQMFNWVSRPQPEFHIAAAATGVVLIALTFSLNGIAIWIRYRLRKQHRN